MNNVHHIDQIDWATFPFKEVAVLCFIRDQGNIMLIHKKTGLGAGKVNAPGGRMEPGETPPQAAVREVQEEIGLTPGNLSLVAELQFVFVDGYSLRGLVFFATTYIGTPISTREADPFWCSETEIPYAQMWADDILWLPRVLAGEKVIGQFVFDNDTMLAHRVKLMEWRQLLC